MANEMPGHGEHAKLRHAINNRLNALSMQVELGLHFYRTGDAEAVERTLGKVVVDCKRFAAEIGELLED